MKKFKRNIIVLSVLAFVCAAVYLNWSYNQKEADALAAGENENAEEVSGEVSENAEATAAADDIEETEDAGLYYIPDETDATMSEYFASVRLNRTQARDSAVATLSTVSETEGASQETIDTALAEITLVAEYTIMEAELESLILAKGFEECVVFINDGGIDVTVPASGEGLSTADVARITDIVLAETDFEAENLTIIEIRE
ncbi:MAG: SpoIIIAH-like family protein [Oscillospiraceae bacterium]|nr:SpoIIIAH-like family protein [Oscillospiraceae bacterium]